jgi:hypothetical protein
LYAVSPTCVFLPSFFPKTKRAIFNKCPSLSSQLNSLFSTSFLVRPPPPLG